MLSNRRKTSGLLLAMLLALGACAGEAPPENVVLGACASALQAEQGTRMQGATFQGTRMQGLTFQGTRMQGLALQGLDPQGLTAQGLTPQGERLAGASINGTALAADAFVRLELREGELAGTLADGAVLRGARLEGVRLPFVTDADETLWIEIARAEPAPDASAPWLYALTLAGQNLCGGDGLGVFVPGVWDDTGRRLPALAAAGRNLEATFSCRAGVIAKCVLWGYEPWAVGAELHQACTRMARADYCGDGVAHTEEGTLIDLFDRQGIQAPAGAPGLSFEAGWDPDGATCVSQPRYLDLVPGGSVALPTCWDEKPHCDSWEKARETGAWLGNESAHTTRELTCAAL